MSKSKRIREFHDETWLLYLEEIDISQYPNMFEKIEVGQGFWLQCR